MMPADNKHYLVVTALGHTDPALFEAVTQLIKQCGGNILRGNVTHYEGEFVFTCLLNGTWSAIAKLEALLILFSQQNQLILKTKRTLPYAHTKGLLYQAQVVAIDRMGILQELASFFQNQHIFIEKLECDSYLSKNYTKMVQVTFILYLPPSQHLATFKEKFMTHCDAHNLEVTIIELIK